MSDLLLYTIKSSFVLALLYVPYTLLLSKEDFFRFNRITLLGILVLSLTLPFCNISPLSLDSHPVVYEAQQQMIEIGIPVVQVVDDTVVEPEANVSVSWFEAVSFIYLLGMFAVLCMRLVQFVRMGMEMRGGCLWRQHEDGVNIYCHANDVMPYSWLNNVVINKGDYESCGHVIIMHEKGHIRYAHSLDIILLTFVQMLQWWNPLTYMLGTSLRDTHEYEADSFVLCHGITLSDYQTLLIKKAVGSSSYTFTNKFNHCLIKKRIVMMNKKKSNPWLRSKVLYAIPMVAIALSAFATPEFIKPIENTVKGVESVGIATLPDIKGIIGSSTNLSAKQEYAPEASVDTAVAMRAKVDVSLPKAVPDRTAVYLNGKQITNEEMQEIDPEAIENVTVIKNSEALVGIDADAAIYIETKELAENKNNDEVFLICEKLPVFEGGKEQLKQFVIQNAHYPVKAHQFGATGTVIVQFVVEKDGSLSDIKIKSNSYKGYVRPESGESHDSIITVTGYKEDEESQKETDMNEAKAALEDEAMRVVRLTSGRWTPGEQRGRKVRVQYTVPLIFMLK